MKIKKPPPPQYAPKVLDKVEQLQLLPCCVCKGIVEKGYHGVWQEGGTCSPKCEVIRENRPKYPDHTEEQFLERFKDALQPMPKAD